MTNDRLETRGTKRRRHVSLSREVDAAVKELLPDYVDFTAFAEQAVLRELVRENGADEVRAAIEDAQADLDDEHLAPEDKRRSVEISG